jgi:hypothetical protein
MMNGGRSEGVDWKKQRARHAQSPLSLTLQVSKCLRLPPHHVSRYFCCQTIRNTSLALGCSLRIAERVKRNKSKRRVHEDIGRDVERRIRRDDTKSSSSKSDFLDPASESKKSLLKKPREEGFDGPERAPSRDHQTEELELSSSALFSRFW